VTATGYVGRSLPRREDERLLRGAGCFVDDVDRQGQVFAAVVRSPAAHARVVEVDVSEALELPGVLAVVTGAELPDVRIPMRIAATPEAELALQRPLASDIVRYVGEPVAIVVATSQYAAEDAVDLVLVDLDPLAPVLDAREAASGDGEPLHAALGGNAVSTLVAVSGEPVDAAFARAHVVVRERLRMHRHAAIPLETRGLVAEYDDSTERLTVWGPAKVKHFNRQALSAMLELPVESIRFVEPDVGGSFGARGEFYPEDFLIPWLALRLRRPVKWIEDRSEHFLAANHSREQECELEVAAASDGTLLAFRFRSWVDVGGYVRTQGMVLPRLTVRHIAGPYRWQGFEAESIGVLTNKTPAGTCRGPGQTESTFFRERVIDVVAGRLGMDPAELRERNLVAADELPLELALGETQTPMVYDSGDYPATWARLMDHVEYGALREELASRRAAGETVGVGLSAFVEEGGAGPWEQAQVVPEPDGRFSVRVGVGSVGQGVGTALAQIAADPLGVPLDAVAVSYQDTDVVPEGLGAFGSRTTVLGGNAVAGAVADLIERARAEAAERLGVEPALVEVTGGYARAPGSGDAIPLSELRCEGSHRYEKPIPSVSMGANLAVVAVDPATGRLRVERYVLAYDVGRAVNPRLVEGQLVGGAAQGIAGALLERLAYDEEGQLMSTSFMDYMMPTACEVPPIEVLVLELSRERPNPANPLGVKGCGEGGTIGAAAALANAVADAVGMPGAAVTLPLVPEVVLGLLDAAGGSPEAGSPLRGADAGGPAG
jgi:carbon-monoxide dehydrogenase large subunit